MDKEPNFESQVLTRLAVIESKLDGFPDLKKVVYANENRSIQNEKEITVIKETLNKYEEKIQQPSKEKAIKWDKLIDYIFYAILAYALFKLGLK